MVTVLDRHRTFSSLLKILLGLVCLHCYSTGHLLIGHEAWLGSEHLLTLEKATHTDRNTHTHTHTHTYTHTHTHTHTEK
jgi:hypothetical protein